MTAQSEKLVVVIGITPGATIRGLSRGQQPVVDWLCSCGAHERAIGHRAAQELAARARPGHCPHTDHEAAA